ncbi:MAG TPA: DMT family transporter [Rhodothermales bacterium]
MPSELPNPALPLEGAHYGDGLPGDAAWPHHALLLLFTLIWGANFVLAEVALAEMTPIAFSVSRFVMGGVGLLAILYLPDGWIRREYPTGRRSRNLGRSDWPRLMLVALMGATLAPWLGIEGLALTSAGRAALWLALAPACSAVVGYLSRTERISRGGQLGLLLAALGTFGMAADGLSPERNYWLGDLLLIAAMVMVVTELHLIRPLAYRYGAARVVALRTAVGGLIYLLIASPALVIQSWTSFSMWTWVAILAGGFVGVGVGQWIKVRALRAVGPTQVVIYGNMVPVATLGIAWATIGAPSTLLEIGAGALIVIGAVCTQVGATPVIAQRSGAMSVRWAAEPLATGEEPLR